VRQVTRAFREAASYWPRGTLYLNATLLVMIGHRFQAHGLGPPKASVWTTCSDKSRTSPTDGNARNYGDQKLPRLTDGCSPAPITVRIRSRRLRYGMPIGSSRWHLSPTEPRGRVSHADLLFQFTGEAPLSQARQVA
jgi:hypothetical protein